MFNIYLLILATLLACIQCVPLDVHSNSSSSHTLHLIVNNSTKATNYKLSPVMEELEDIDEEIAKELDSILPLFHVLFDSLFGHPQTDDSNDCVDDMIIQLVPDTPEEHQILEA